MGLLGVGAEELHDLLGAGADFSIANGGGVDVSNGHDLFIAGGDEGFVEVGYFAEVDGLELDGEMGLCELEDDLTGDADEHLFGAAGVEDIILEGKKVAGGGFKDLIFAIEIEGFLSVLGFAALHGDDGRGVLGGFTRGYAAA